MRKFGRPKLPPDLKRTKLLSFRLTTSEVEAIAKFETMTGNCASVLGRELLMKLVTSRLDEMAPAQDVTQRIS